MLLESEYMCREGTRLQTEMCTIDTYMVVASSCRTLDLVMNSGHMYNDKVGEEGEREGVRKAERREGGWEEERPMGLLRWRFNLSQTKQSL